MTEYVPLDMRYVRSAEAFLPIAQFPEKNGWQGQINLDQLLSERKQAEKEKHTLMFSFIKERRDLEQENIGKLEAIMQKCKRHLFSVETRYPLADEMLRKWEREIIQCEKDIMREKVTSLSDVFCFFEKM